jgi:plasmid maintenance system antidote protein VapI
LSITFYSAILALVEPSSRVTIRDVAARAGVSVATVSKVINGRYGVAASTGTRVQAVIDDLDYEASLVAQSLRHPRTNVIGIVAAGPEPFSTGLLKGAADAMSAIATPPARHHQPAHPPCGPAINPPPPARTDPT